MNAPLLEGLLDDLVVWCGGDHSARRTKRVDRGLARAAQDPRGTIALVKQLARDPARKRMRAYVYIALAGDADADARLRLLLVSSDRTVRAAAVAAIRARASQCAYTAPWLAAQLQRERHPDVHALLVLACGEVRTRETLRALLAIARIDAKKRSDDRSRILRALIAHASPRSRAYFRAVFAAANGASRFHVAHAQQVLAAWGLCALEERPESARAAYALLQARRADRRARVPLAGGGYGVDPGLAREAREALGALARR